MTLPTVLPLFVYDLYVLDHHLYPYLWGRGHRRPTIQRAKKMGQHTEGIVLAFSLLTSEAAFLACDGRATPLLGAPVATCSALQMTWRAEDCCCTRAVPPKPPHARRSHLSLRNLSLRNPISSLLTGA